MSILARLRTRFAKSAEPDSPKPEFLRFKAVAGAIPQLPDNSPNKKMLTDLLLKDPNQVTWDEIQAGQIVLTEMMPLQMLQAQFGSLSDEYEAVTGSKPFVHGTFQNPPEAHEGWSAGVVNLIVELAKFRRAKLLFERRLTVVGTILFVILIVVGVLGVWHWGGGPVPLWQPLLLSGFIGAGFSVLTRLYALAWSKLTSQIEDVRAFELGLVTNCVLSVAKGVIAACVIYLLFASGLLKGDLFPAMHAPTPKTPPDSFVELFKQEPDKASDMAKLFIWAFIAGFAERLVPDKLSRLAGEASDPKKKKQPSGAQTRHR